MTFFKFYQVQCSLSCSRLFVTIRNLLIESSWVPVGIDGEVSFEESMVGQLGRINGGSAWKNQWYVSLEESIVKSSTIYWILLRRSIDVEGFRHLMLFCNNLGSASNFDVRIGLIFRTLSIIASGGSFWSSSSVKSLSSDGHYCSRFFFSNGLRDLLDNFLRVFERFCSDSSIIRLSGSVTILNECIRMFYVI